MKTNYELDVTIKDIDICECECHVKGRNIMHAAPCCELCMDDYIVDGEIDMVLWGRAYRRAHDPRFQDNTREGIISSN